MGRDRIVIEVPPAPEPLGAWLDALLAGDERNGSPGLSRVRRESTVPPDTPADGATPIRLRFRTGSTAGDDRREEKEESAVGPAITFGLSTPAGIGAELFRWQLAAGDRGAVLGVLPYDLPTEAGLDGAGRAHRPVAGSVGLRHEDPGEDRGSRGRPPGFGGRT